jgi:hypothetical protein
MPRYCISIPANGEIIVLVEAKSPRAAIKKLTENFDSYEIPSTDPDVVYRDGGGHSKRRVGGPG